MSKNDKKKEAPTLEVIRRKAQKLTEDPLDLDPIDDFMTCPNGHLMDVRSRDALYGENKAQNIPCPIDRKMHQCGEWKKAHQFEQLWSLFKQMDGASQAEIKPLKAELQRTKKTLSKVNIVFATVSMMTLIGVGVYGYWRDRGPSDGAEPLAVPCTSLMTPEEQSVNTVLQTIGLLTTQLPAILSAQMAAALAAATEGYQTHLFKMMKPLLKLCSPDDFSEQICIPEENPAIRIHALLNQAHILSQHGDAPGAIALFNKALGLCSPELESLSISIRTSLLDLYVQQHNTEAVVNQASILIGKFSTSKLSTISQIKALSARGLGYKEQDRRQQAIKDFKRALNLLNQLTEKTEDPQELKALSFLHLSDIYTKQHDFIEANKYVSKALKLSNFLNPNIVAELYAWRIYWFQALKMDGDEFFSNTIKFQRYVEHLSKGKIIKTLSPVKSYIHKKEQEYASQKSLTFNQSILYLNELRPYLQAVYELEKSVGNESSLVALYSLHFKRSQHYVKAARLKEAIPDLEFVEQNFPRVLTMSPATFPDDGFIILVNCYQNLLVIYKKLGDHLKLFDYTTKVIEFIERVKNSLEYFPNPATFYILRMELAMLDDFRDDVNYKQLRVKDANTVIELSDQYEVSLSDIDLAKEMLKISDAELIPIVAAVKKFGILGPQSSAEKGDQQGVAASLIPG